MEINQRLYTKEPDGTVQTWHVQGWVGPNFAVSTVKNAKLKDYKRYYNVNDAGVKIHFTRKQAAASSPVWY